MEEKPRIIVVDDTIENINAAKEFFDSLKKFPVDYATSLKQGEKLLREYWSKYFLAIFDLDLPREQGREIIKRAGLELGKIADEKDIFHVYFSGGFHHGGPKTYFYLEKDEVLSNKPAGSVTSKSLAQGWRELYKILTNPGLGDVGTGELEEALKRYEKYVGKKFDWRLVPKPYRLVLVDKFYS